MTYSTEPRLRKYVKGYGFLSIARKFGDKPKEKKSQKRKKNQKKNQKKYIFHQTKGNKLLTI